MDGNVARVVSSVASHRVAEHIRQQILRGELAPGTRIIQDEIATALSTSRIPVREALRILHADGLVVLRSNHGAWVSSMNLHDCEITYKARERLEPLLLSEALPGLTDEVLDRVELVQDEIEQTEEVERFLVLDRELHWLTYRGSGAPDLEAIAARMWDTTQHYRRAFTRMLGQSRRWIINSEHRLLIDCLRRRDSASAEQVLAGHIRRTRMELTAHPELFDEPV